jgi:predicted  nucleic acid-binding Zn-ribbon protein
MHSQEDEAMNESKPWSMDPFGHIPAELQSLRDVIAMQQNEIKRLRGEVERLESEREVQDAALECKRQDYRELVKITEAELAALRQRARMPDELVDRVRDMKQRGLMVDDQEIADLLRDILAWHEQ